MTDHIRTRQKLKDICLIDTFDGLLEQCTLSDTDKQLLRLHYIQEKDFRYIGDTLGYSEATIKARHKKALRKLGSLL